MTTTGDLDDGKPNDSGRGVLENIRIVDFGQYLAGPMVAMFMADLGADVIRVDPPGGPRWDSPANAVLQRGKRSIVLDLKHSEDLETARALINTADVVIEGFRPGVMDRLGLGFGTFSETNERLIWCALPGFSKDDPRADLPGWEGIVSAATGIYTPGMGNLEGKPIFSSLPVASTFAAIMAAHRIAAALVARERFGGGAAIEVSLFHAAFQALGGFSEMPLSRMYGVTPVARLRPLYNNLKTADGKYFNLGTPARGVQALLDRLIPGTDLLRLDDDGVKTLRARLEAIWVQRTAAEWERYTQEEIGVASAIVMTTEEWLADEDALETQTVVEVEDHQLGSTRQAGTPVWLSRTPARISGPRRPAGSDQEEVLTELASHQPRTKAPLPDPGRQALEGLRVIDASTLLAGPTTARILAQYGAEVIKIEKAGIARGENNPMADDLSYLLSHRTMNAGKRMMFLDIKHEESANVLERLFQTADIVHHNYTSGSAGRLGFSSDQIRRRRPDAIVSSLTLHSAGGRRAGYRGHEDLAQAETGVCVRVAGDERPATMSPIMINDHGTGHLLAFGILLAVFHRLRTGEAQDVNMALSRMSTLHQLPFALAYNGRVWDEPSGRDAVGWDASNRLYQASDGWFYLACPGADFRSRISSAAGLEGAESIAEADLEGWLAQRMLEAPVAEWVDRLSAGGIAAHRHLSVDEVSRDPVSVALKATAVLEHPGLGMALGIGFPSFGRTDEPLLAARRPGMDTVAILESLGFDPRSILQMAVDGAVAFGENPVVTTTTMPGYWSRPESVLSLASAESVRQTISGIPDLAEAGQLGASLGSTGPGRRALALCLGREHAVGQDAAEEVRRGPTLLWSADEAHGDAEFIARRVDPLPEGFLDRASMTFQFFNQSWLIRADGLTVLVDRATGTGADAVYRTSTIATCRGWTGCTRRARHPRPSTWCSALTCTTITADGTQPGKGTAECRRSRGHGTC